MLATSMLRICFFSDKVLVHRICKYFLHEFLGTYSWLNCHCSSCDWRAHCTSQMKMTPPGWHQRLTFHHQRAFCLMFEELGMFKSNNLWLQNFKRWSPSVHTRPKFSMQAYILNFPPSSTPRNRQSQQ